MHALAPRFDVARATISILICPAACCMALILYFADKQTLCISFYLEFEKFNDKRSRENAPQFRVTEFRGSPGYEQTECLLCESQRERTWRAREYIHISYLRSLFIKPKICDA